LQENGVMGGLAKQLITPTIFLGALGLLVAITSVFAKPKRLAASVEFPPPWGAKVVTWAVLGFCLLLLLASVEVQYYWLAVLFGLCPLYSIWRWPETIQIDEFRIHSSAWCHRDVSMLWSEIESIKLGRSGDSVTLHSRSGVKIAISASQVGADQLSAEITRRTGIPFPSWEVTF
jgi:hypothetical protein